jgi:hypothetical protein
MAGGIGARLTHQSERPFADAWKKTQGFPHADRVGEVRWL